MKQITSSQNSIYKSLRALATSSKTRRQQKQTLLEGIHLAESFLRTGKTPSSCVVSESAQSNPEVMAIIRECEKRDVLLVSVSNSLFQTISSVDNGIGLLLCINQPEKATTPPLTQSSILLDTVQDPGNVGAILRTAAAAGIETVYCSAQTAAVWSPKVLRAGMGAHFALTIYEDTNLLDLVSSAAVPVYATSLQATQSIYDVNLVEPAAWIIGNEGQGVSAELLQPPVQQVIIPQNHEVESLNAAAAAAVCLFEQRRQVLAKNRF